MKFYVQFIGQAMKRTVTGDLNDMVLEKIQHNVR